ncbi:Stk1 family PASTA domain-containing Ser/Thr kinase [Bifidobacterium pseudocatenulatum]|uniref:Stk1 family PASTA domain-containing Ser/Thr kinase n=1 Tax=Bifidobacterium pseudocatenulatum TaxID=28026 RepID=UPI001C8AFB1E|nr:Stk1 family PASTA domain-containing Ser/Thr kinase [Bifidobacterium pseudocatenulatum]CAG9072080.1 Serine/threonine-protein kinase PknB [Bifidobacterium pseudocatenulatum]
MNINMPTSLAGGRYQLGQLVGRGGMAEVHVALDTRLGRTVAVKIMRADFANDKIFLERFRREAHSVAQMNNPNIVNIYDSGEEVVATETGQTEHLPYLVMEYVKGQTLRDILKVNGALSQRDAEQVMMGVLNALEYSHRMGIIHRDIKPGNIMISEQGVVKVMDFGIARTLDDSAATMTQSQGVVGTAQYLSPEQARGESVDMRSDLYSAGCVLYEMLTGRPPFTGDSAAAIAYQHVSEVATPPSSVVPGLPKMWDSICAKAMAKDRQNRYATASEFKNDLLTFMNGGVPMAAAFNPLTDLTNMKARKQAEMDANTVAMTPAGETAATQAFNPVTGQFEAVPNPQNGVSTKTRAEQRAEAAKARKKKQIIIGSVVGGLVALLVILGVFFMLNKSGSTADMVEVPDFTATANISEARVEEQLAAKGLKLDAREDSDSSEPKGTITKQNPTGGKKVAKGSTVSVWFSTGPQSVAVPDVSNKSQDDAKSILEAAGFKVGNVRTVDNASIEKDKVVSTDPAAHSKQTKGTIITLYISSGMTKIPDNLIGQPKDTVIEQLKQAGLTQITIESEYSDSIASGAVTRVEPGVGSTVEAGTAVTIWVSTGKQQISVPSVVGMGYAGAKSLLESYGFQVTVSGPEDGTVTDMSPTAGTQSDSGATITLTTKSSSTNNGGNNGNNGNNGGNGGNTDGGKTTPEGN